MFNSFCEGKLSVMKNHQLPHYGITNKAKVRVDEYCVVRKEIADSDMTSLAFSVGSFTQAQLNKAYVQERDGLDVMEEHEARPHIQAD
jgi:hypothetical protein